MILSEKSERYRVIYLDEVARFHLKRYLDTRTDDNPALFVAQRKPFARLSVNGLRDVIKRIGKREGMSCRYIRTRCVKRSA